MDSSIAIYDWQTVLECIKSVAWVVLLGFVVSLAIKAKLLPKQSRGMLIILFATWAVAAVSLTAVNAYNYLDTQRPVIEKSLQMQP